MPIRALHIQNAFVLLVFVVGIAVSAVVATFYQKNWHTAIVQAFEDAATERVDTIYQYLKYNEMVLRSVNALYRSSQKVSREEFATYTSELLVNTPFLRAVEWIPRVKDADRAVIEKEAAQALPGFSFKERDEKGALVPAKRRDVYYPILYAEPVEDSRAIIGKDLALDPVRFAALQAARKTGQMRISGIVPIWQASSDAGAKGALFVMPVYKTRKKQGEVEGFVASVISLYDLVENAIKPLRKAGVNLLIHDVSEKKPDQSLLYVRSTRLKDIPHEEIIADFITGTKLLHKTQFDVAGRTWEITIIPARGFFSTSPGSAFYGILGGGILCTTLLTAFLLMLTTRADVIQQQVTEKTLTLQQLTEKLS